MKNKKRYYASQAYNGIKRIPKKKGISKKEYVIMAYIIGVEGLSNQMVAEEYHKIKEIVNTEEYTSFGNLEIKNIVICDRSSEKFDVKLLYPTPREIKTELYQYLTKHQKRRVEIYNLLDTL